jgi:nicotinamide-nucleotide amidase
MLSGAIRKMKGDFCIATSGIMGPGGGSIEKPVGTVWVAAGSSEKVITSKFHFRFDRNRNIEIASVQALNLLRKFLESSANIR